MATKYEGLTSAQWANRIVEYNPGKFDKSALVKHYTAQQLGKFQEGGNIQLAKALKGAKTPAKKSSDEDAVKFIKAIIIVPLPGGPTAVPLRGERRFPVTRCTPVSSAAHNRNRI